MNGLRWTPGHPHALVAAFVMLGVPCAARADEPGPPPPVESPAPDKSDSSLFNPVPAAALRGFSADRPTKSFLPYTVDAGHVQVESDFAVYGITTQDGQKTRNWTVFDPTLKLGLTNSADFELQVITYQAAISHAGPTRTSASGWGDAYAKVKLNLIGNDGGKLAVALLPYVKAPTARAPLGNGAVEGGLIVPVSIAVPHGFTIVFSPEFDWLRNGTGPGYHGSTTFLVNLSHPVGKVWTVYAEAFTTRSFQHGDTPLYTFDTAASVAITPTLQWDFGANIKVSGPAPDAQIYTGFARRF